MIHDIGGGRSPAHRLIGGKHIQRTWGHAKSARHHGAGNNLLSHKQSKLFAFISIAAGKPGN